MYCNVILPFTARSSEKSLPFRFSDKKCCKHFSNPQFVQIIAITIKPQHFVLFLAVLDLFRSRVATNMCKASWVRAENVKGKGKVVPVLN
jgi:hypothetical protein